MRNFSTDHPLALRIKQYSLLAGTMTAYAAISHAQTVYTDVNPDITISAGQEYLLDLNNDGIADFKYRVFYSASYSKFKADVDSFGNNNVGATYENIPYEYADAFALGFKEKIGPLTPSWWNQSVFDHPSMNGIFGVEGLWSPNEQASLDKFMALQLEQNGNNYYGWVRLTESADNTKLTIKDYAYEATAGKGTYAGKGLGDCIDSYENNDSFFDAEITKPGNKFGIIGSANDVDIFRVKLPYTSAFNLRLKLKQLPDDYDLYLYDFNQNLLKKSINNGTTKELIQHSIPLSSSGVFFYIKVAPKGIAYDPNTCYHLSIELKDTDLKEAEESTANLSIKTISVFPNPVNDRLTIGLPDLFSGNYKIKITDITGKIIYTEIISLYEQNSIDIANIFLGNGTYIVTVGNERSFYVSKFLVNH